MTDNGRIVVAGSITMDVIARCEEHPEPGETVKGKDIQYTPGGKGNNQAIAAGRLGSEVKLVGRVGDDAFGSQVLDILEEEPMDVSSVEVSRDNHTGTALIWVDDSSENEIVIVPGSNDELSPSDLDGLELREEDIALSVFEVPHETIEELFRKARKAGTETVLNPAPAEECSDALLELVDVLVVNEMELAYFAGTDSVPSSREEVVAAARDLRVSTDQVIVATLGADGLVCLDGEEMIDVAGRDVAAVDTTGAGDCFVGALVTALQEDKSLRDALEFANAVAAVSVQQKGTSSSLPDREAVDMFLEER
jgi:ribokinase